MANWSDPHTTAAPYATAAGTRDSAAYDAGLRSYMLSVYNYMASGVLLSGIVALMFAWGGSESIAASVFANGGPLVWLIILSPLAIVLAMSFGAEQVLDARAAGHVLGVHGADGPVALDAAAALHRDFGRPGVLRRRSRLRGPEPLWLHDQEGSVGLRQLP